MAITPVALSGNDLSALGQINRNEKSQAASKGNSFDVFLNAAVDMYKETDALQKKAEEMEMSFALGYTDSIHDVAMAQQKANISLQYTVKITNAVVSAYKELMNLQL